MLNDYDMLQHRARATHATNAGKLVQLLKFGSKCRRASRAAWERGSEAAAIGTFAL